ncbi:MAG TPA: ABC transporter ATP-binding protein, partial [Vicingus sp.]|nr:ABC transporter ATP-binding protein [Vicingus sp.]
EALEKEAEKQKNVTQTVVEQPKQEQPKTKLSFKEKFELEQLEKELPQLEEQKEKLIAQLADSSTNHEELVKLTQKLGFVTKQLDEKTNRWLILSEIEG